MCLVGAKAGGDLRRGEARRRRDAAGVAAHRMDHRFVSQPFGEVRVRLGRPDIVEAGIDEPDAGERARRAGRHRRERHQPQGLPLRHALPNAARREWLRRGPDPPECSRMFVVTDAAACWICQRGSGQSGQCRAVSSRSARSGESSRCSWSLRAHARGAVMDNAPAMGTENGCGFRLDRLTTGIHPAEHGWGAVGKWFVREPDQRRRALPKRRDAPA